MTFLDEMKIMENTWIPNPFLVCHRFKTSEQDQHKICCAVIEHHIMTWTIFGGKVIGINLLFFT